MEHVLLFVFNWCSTMNCLLLVFLLVAHVCGFESEYNSIFYNKGGCTPHTVTFNSVHPYKYRQDCSRDSSDRSALKFSGGKMNCGRNGKRMTPDEPQIVIEDPDNFKTSYIKSVCLVVRGVNSVTIDFYNAFWNVELPDYIEDLSNSGSGWNTVCFIPEWDDCEAHAFEIYLEPNNDRSKVKVKDVILELCRFEWSTYHSTWSYSSYSSYSSSKP